MANKKQSKRENATDAGKGGVEQREGGVGVRRFLQEVMAEFHKIVWPARKVTAGLTGFVLILVVLLSLYLGSVDLLLGGLVTFILH